MRWRPVVALVLTLAAACNRDHRPTGSDSTTFVEIPVPPPGVSRFDVPLRYDFTPVLAIVERALPKTFGSLDSVHQVGDDDRKHYAFEAVRGPFKAFAQGTEVHMQATLSYSARGYYKPIIGPTISAGCGNDEERPRIVVELVTPLTLSSNWHLRSKSAVARVHAASATDRDRCKVSILNFDVTDRVVDAARGGVTSQLAEIDRKIAAIDLTERATGWWRLLNQPIHLADSVWLVLQPEQIRVGRVTGDGHTLTVRAGLDAHPRIVTGAEPILTVLPLPPVGRDTTAGGFNILLEGIVDYATASRVISEAVRGKVVTHSGRSVTLGAVTVSPQSGGQLALDVMFSGDATGSLRFVGTPVYLASAGEITVPDLNYALQTNDALIRTFAWLRSDDLRALFLDKARVPVGPVLDKGRELLLAGLNRKIGDVMTLTGTVDSVSVGGIYVTRAGLLVRAGASGMARVSVKEQK